MRKIFAANWKTNPSTIREAENAMRAFSSAPSFDTIVFAPALFIAPLIKTFQSKKIFAGGQNAWLNGLGASTGELSASMFKKMGVRYILAGHSERRKIFHETDEEVSKKACAFFAASITPLVCVGEDIHTRRLGSLVAKKQVRAMLRASLRHTEAYTTRELVIAYEPIWAIGAKESASVSEAEDMIMMLREEATLLGFKKNRILYGGSVDEKNIASFWRSSQIDGVLVGRASVVPKSIRGMMKKIISV